MNPLAPSSRNSLSIAFFFLSCCTLSAVTAPAPSTIPAIQQWTAGTGTCVFSAASRIVINSGDAAALTADAQTFANDLCGLLGRAITVATGATAGNGDVFLKLGATNTAIGDEGYLLNISTHFEISAKTAAGIFYGTRTMLQMLKQGTTVNQGSIVDWPRGRWRGVMVDAGRKYYTMAWLQTFIRDMAYTKMNLFHFHLSDGLTQTNNGGFRLQSTTHPEITSTQYYSKTELQSLIALASQYHITIIPEIDLPGHVNWLYASHRNLLLGSRVLGNQYWALDLSKDSSYTFIRELLSEFIPLFPGPFWHIGADEYMFIDEYATFPQLTTWARNRYGSNAHANDCYRHFVNWANELVRAQGKTAWAWNDVLLGITGTSVGACTLATDITMDHWGALNWIGWGGVYPSAELARGYTMINCSWDLFYIITTNAKTTGDPQWAYNSWELNTFAGGNIPAGDPHIQGGKYPIWGDAPSAETEAQVWTGTFMLSRAVAQKCWGSPKIQATYAAFQTLANSVARAPAPVVSLSAGERFARRDSGVFETVAIHDLRGALIATLSAGAFSREAASGLPHLRDGKRRLIGAGPYLCRFRGMEGEKTSLMVLSR
ncbi:MAG: family 20 glycosylhydrolase [Chitinispirillaceae bacterium]|nr:family 20 glycosylhydrolase [Chitinispirillaceae bacterium]